MNFEHRCVLCNQEAKMHQPQRDEFYIECKTCGKYGLDDLTENEFKTNRSKEERAMISAYTRELLEHNASPPKLHILNNQGEIEKIIEKYRNKTIYEKLGKLILYIEKKSNYFGESIEIDFSKDYPVTYSKNTSEFENLCRRGNDVRFLSMTGHTGNEQEVELTWDGWQEAERIKEAGPLSKKCYVAMSFDPSLEEIYENGIKPAIIEAGYDPIRTDKEEHNEKICDLIIAEIQSCKFLVADFTGQRQNVYYEASFAYGLNRDVIWTCRQDEISNVHFDTRQYNHIVWENAEDLKKKLVNRIKATIL